MPRNIEIKARIDDLPALTARAAALATEGPIEINQDDTFFHCAKGRLKLRSFSSTSGELIFYQRADAQGPKESFYVISPTSEVDSLRETLTLAYGQSGRVRKRRILFLAGRTRIHLDDVEGLGQFLELEVVLAADEPIEAGVLEAKVIMRQLDIAEHHLLEGAYVDLLVAKSSPERPEPSRRDYK
jgi:predicted adenylyl cyclase CyaB